MLNPAVEVVVRAQSEMEASVLRQEPVDKVLLAEHELADGITRHILGRMRGGAGSGHPLS
jgi:CPA2 family monovalent cation:H+ antiporter-2